MTAAQLMYNDRVQEAPLQWKKHERGPDDWPLDGNETLVAHWHTPDEDFYATIDEVVIDRPFAFSPAETPAAASVHRPEIETRCSICGLASCDCEASIDEDEDDPRGVFVELDD